MTDFKVKQTEGQSELLISRGGQRAGAGRKKIGETRRLSLTLPAETWAAIDAAADRGRMKTAEVIRDKLNGEAERAMIRVCLHTYCQLVSDRLNRNTFNTSFEYAARDAIYKAIGVDVTKIEFDGKADTVLYSKLLALYNEKTGENRAVL